MSKTEREFWPKANAKANAKANDRRVLSLDPGAIMRLETAIRGGNFTCLAGVIAIDGPVGSGKTVVGREVARRLGFKFVDTGVMYRAITWLALQRGTPTDDEEALGALAEGHPMRIQGSASDKVLVGGWLIGPELRETRVNGQVSFVASMLAVRKALVRQQRLLATEGRIIMAGRDIGTVVLPNADLKIFLTASPASRAQRRWRELQDSGQTVEFQQILEETKARDDIDTQRTHSPLAPAQDAFMLDTEGLAVRQVVERILERFNQLPTTGEP